MLKILASFSSFKTVQCGSPNSDLSENMKKRGKTRRGMARPLENSKIQFGKVVR